MNIKKHLLQRGMRLAVLMLFWWPWSGSAETPAELLARMEQKRMEIETQRQAEAPYRKNPYCQEKLRALRLDIKESKAALNAAKEAREQRERTYHLYGLFEDLLATKQRCQLKENYQTEE